MSNAITIRLKEGQAERLEQFARRFGKSQSEMGALFIEEGMREAEFARIEFRDSVIGRQAYMQGSNLAVWEVIMVARDHDMDAERTAEYFNRPVEWVKAAVNYYQAFHQEIDQSIEDNDISYEEARRLLPNVRLHEVPDEVVAAKQNL